MATTFYLQSDNAVAGPNFTSGDDFLLALARDIGSARDHSGTCVSSGNHILLDVANSPVFWYRVAAVTISGTISFNVWGRESLMTTNAQPAARIGRYDGSGTFISDVVANANANHADGVEFATANSLATWTATPTSTTFNNGDWLAFEPHLDAIGTMGTGTGVWSYGANTGGVDGDTFVTFTETINPYVPPAGYTYPKSTVWNNRRLYL